MGASGPTGSPRRVHTLNNAFKLPQPAAQTVMLEAILLLFYYKLPVTWHVSAWYYNIVCMRRYVMIAS